jgi:hypothetical protein
MDVNVPPPVAVYSYEYITSKRHNWWFNRSKFVMPLEYMNNVYPLIKNFGYNRYSSFGTIDRCVFDLTDFNSHECVIKLAVSFLWHKFIDSHFNNEGSDIVLTRIIQAELKRLFNGFTRTADITWHLASYRDCYAVGLVILTKFLEWSRDSTFLFEIINYFAYTAPFKCTTPQNRNPLGISTIHICYSEFYSFIDNRLVSSYLKFVELLEERDRGKKIADDRHQEVLTFLKITDFTDEETKLVVGFLCNIPNYGKMSWDDPNYHKSIDDARTTLVDIIEDLYSVGFAIRIKILRHKLDNAVKFPRIVMYGGEEICVGCWLVERTYYHYQGKKYCKTHDPLPEQPLQPFLPPSMPPPAVEPSAPPLVEPSAPPLEPLEEPPAEINDSRDCEICMSAEKNTAFVPCGHLACPSCAPKLKQCHICRSAIYTTLKIFI